MSLTGIPEGDPLFMDVADLCQSVSGFNPLSGEQTGAELSDSIRLQLFGTTMSLYRNELQQHHHRSGPPPIVAEHSMGIYPALAASGSIDKSTALELTVRIGTCLASMGKKCEYALGSVIGLSLELLESVASNNHVQIANYNTSRHFLLAGEWDRICSATVEAEAIGSFSVGVFPCNAPLHTHQITDVESDLRAIVADYSFRDPVFPLMNHLDQCFLKTDDIPDFLVMELCRPVFWEKTYCALKQHGVSHFIELGAGQSLTKFNRWIDSDL
jgi:malonyl CoA-acyl carrier protein transacylase